MRVHLVAVAMLVLPATAPAADLNISEHSDQHVRGSFSTPEHTPIDEGVPLDADMFPAPGSKMAQPGLRKVKPATIHFDSKCTSKRCTVNFVLDGKPVRVYQDFPDETVHIRFGNYKMTEQTRDAFVELEKQLDMSRLPWTPAENLLFRMVTLLTDAPIGGKVGNSDVTKPKDKESAAEPAPENMTLVPQDENHWNDPDTRPEIDPDTGRRLAPGEPSDAEARDMAVDAGDDAPLNPNDPWAPPPMIPFPLLPEPQSMRDGDCVVDPLGIHRPSHLFMLAATCCMTCPIPNAGERLPCWPRGGNHFTWTYHSANAGPNVAFKCGNTVMTGGKHCVAGFYLPYGTRAFNRFKCSYGYCPGRCGLRCSNPSNPSAWTYNCLDHDYCVSSHNGNAVSPTDPNCGDEWHRAYRDYLFFKPDFGTC